MLVRFLRLVKYCSFVLQEQNHRYSSGNEESRSAGAGFLFVKCRIHEQVVKSKQASRQPADLTYSLPTCPMILG
jgi:hypothetical protein